MPKTDLNLLMGFILLLITAGFTSYYASRKGRDPLLWFVVGMLLGIFSLIILLFFPAIKKEKNSPAMPSTTSFPPADEGENDRQPLGALAEIRQQEENKLWYYLDRNHQQVGPVSIVALRELWNRGQLELNSYVWTEGMEQWDRVDNLPNLKITLGNVQ